MLKTLVSSLFFLSLAGAAAAQSGPVLYKCELPNRPSRSFLSKRLDIVFFPQMRRARAADGLIWMKFHHAIPVHVITVDARRVTFQWVVRNVRGSINGQPSVLAGVQETATVLTSGKLFVTQYPLAVDNSFSARGSCTATPVRRRHG